MLHRPSIRARLVPVLATGLLLAACGGAVIEDATTADVAAPTAQPVEADPVDDAEVDDGAEGIQVNGDWEVVVRDQDGSIVSRDRFHNDLVGPDVLAHLLGDQTAGLWNLWIAVESSSALCDAAVNPACRFDTDRTVEGDATVLVTTVQAVADGDFATVETAAQYEYGGGSTRTVLFTSRDLDDPIAFVEGQTVEITVTISFS